MVVYSIYLTHTTVISIRQLKSKLTVMYHRLNGLESRSLVYYQAKKGAF